MKRKTLIWSVILALVVVLVGGGTYYTLAMQAGEGAQTAADSQESTQTGVARSGDLIIFASGTGTLVSQDETTLKFDESGTLIELLVGIGDQVSAGDVLARLQIEKTETQLAAEIAQAELTVLKNQQALDTLYAEAEIKAAQALFDLETAQDALADLLNNDLAVAQAMQAVAAAEAEIQDAEMMLYIHNSSPEADDIYTAYASLLFKEKELAELEVQLEQLNNQYLKAKDKTIRDRLNSQIERVTAQYYNQQVEVENARYRYETIDEPADSLDVSLAQSQLVTAQARLDEANQALAEAQLGAPAGDLAQAEAAVAEARAEWERWQDGPDPADVLLAETSLEAAQLDLQLVQQESLVVELIAPMDGTIMEIHADVNQVIENSRVLTLADTSQPLVEVYLDETDFESAVAGSRVEVIFDALPDMTFTGSLLEISPSLETASNSQVVQGLALLQDLELALPVGLNGAVDVIAGEAVNAVLVPVEALQETSPGNYAVDVQNGDSFEPREVTVGLMDYTSAEILSGLDAGEVVALTAVE